MKKFIYVFGLMLLPVLAGAQADLGNDGGIGRLLTFVGSLIATLIPLVIGAAVLVFLWGVLKFVLAGGDPDKRTEARNTMIWGIIAIFVMVSVWGLVNVLISTFGLEAGQDSIPDAPGIPPPPGF